MYTLTISGDDRGISNIKYTGDQIDYIDIANATDLSLILDWLKCIDLIDSYYQENNKFPLKEMEEKLL